MVGPLRGFFERGAKHPFADCADESCFLGERDEFGRRNGPPARVLPAYERLEPGDVLACGVNDGLVMNRKLAPLERLAEVVFEQLPLGCLTVHRRFVEAMLAPPGALGSV